MNEREGCIREDQDLQPNQAVTTLYLTSAKPWKIPNVKLFQKFEHINLLMT